MNDDFPIKGQLTATQEKLILIALGGVILFFWVAAAVGCWTIWVRILR